MAIFESYQQFDLRANRQDYSSTRKAWDWRKGYLGRGYKNERYTQEDPTKNESNSWEQAKNSALEWNNPSRWNNSYEVSESSKSLSSFVALSNNKSMEAETEEEGLTNGS